MNATEMEALQERVQQRFDDERAAAEKRRAGAAKLRDAEVAKSVKAQVEFQALSEQAASLTDAEQKVPLKLVQRMERVNGRALHFMRRAIRQSNEVAAARKVLDSLSGAELSHRVNKAQKLVRTAEIHGIESIGVGACEVVLINAGRPMHYKEITRVALECGLIQTRGKTPKQTISGYLVRAAGEGDPHATFVRTGPGIFDLSARGAK